MTRLDWLRSRQLGLGGSDLGQIPSIVAACGGDPERDCSPWGSEWHVWASKRGEPEERTPNSQMVAGNYLESAVAKWAMDEVGADGLRQHHGSIRSAVAPLCGTPDYHLTAAPVDCDHEPEVVDGLECKVDDAWRPWEVVPFYYRLQCATYMHLTGRDRWLLAVFFRHIPRFHLYEIERDHDFEAALVAAASGWWQRHIIEGQHPPIDDTADCTRGLAALHPRETGASFGDYRLATDEELGLIQRIQQAESVRNDIDADIATYRNRLRALIGDAPGLRWTGGSVRWSRNRLNIKTDQEAR